MRKKLVGPSPSPRPFILTLILTLTGQVREKLVDVEEMLEVARR